MAFEDGRQQVVADIIVLVLGARREIDAALERQYSCNCLVVIAGALAQWGPAKQPEGVANSARMREQMADGDMVVAVTPVGNVLLNLVIERELSLLGCQQDTHRRKRLCDRRDGENRLRRIGYIELEVRLPVGVFVEDGAVAADTDRAAG